MALSFDGVDDKVEHTTASILDSGTVMSMLTWLYITAVGEASVRLLALPEASTDLRWFLTSATNTEMQLQYNFTGGGSADGIWRSPTDSLALGRWFCVALTYDYSSVANDPLMYIWDTASDKRLSSVTVTELTTPIGSGAAPATGYCVGNISAQTATLNGRLANMQFWKRILGLEELNVAAHYPGRVTNSLRLFLPLNVGGEDWSGLAQNGTVTGAVVADGPPCSAPYIGVFGWPGAFTAPPPAGGQPYMPRHQGLPTAAGYRDRPSRWN